MSKKTEISKDDLVIQTSSLGATLISCKFKGRELTVFPRNELENDSYMGVTAGRYANRIKNGKYGEYSLTINNGPHHLHGGVDGFNKRPWGQTFECGAINVNGEKINYEGVRFKLESPDGDQGYPGNLVAESLIALGSGNRLIFEWTAKTDKETPCNLTNHTYWNLSGAPQSTIRNHTIELYGPGYWPVDDTLIPRGDLVRSTAKLTDDWDHCFVNHLKKDGALNPAAKLIGPDGLSMLVETTYPGLQLYTGNFMEGEFVRNGAVCLEAQYFPDSPNQAERYRQWGAEQGIGADQLARWDGLLTPGTSFRHVAIHTFSA